MSSFHVGMKVVCVDDRTNDGLAKLREIDKGRVYEIAKVGSEELLGKSLISIWLVGVKRIPTTVWIDGNRIILDDDFGFRTSRFRPVVQRKTDIAIFKAMLNPQKTSVSA